MWNPYQSICLQNVSSYRPHDEPQPTFCHKIIDTTVCKDDSSCFWNNTNQRCMTSVCTDYGYDLCSASSPFCRWNATVQRCLHNTTNYPSTNCPVAPFGQRDWCKAIDTCFWNSTYQRCQQSNCLGNSLWECAQNLPRCMWNPYQSICLQNVSSYRPHDEPQPTFCHKIIDTTVCKDDSSCFWNNTNQRCMTSVCTDYGYDLCSASSPFCRWNATVQRCLHNTTNYPSINCPVAPFGQRDWCKAIDTCFWNSTYQRCQQSNCLGNSLWECAQNMPQCTWNPYQSMCVQNVSYSSDVVVGDQGASAHDEGSASSSSSTLVIALAAALGVCLLLIAVMSVTLLRRRTGEKRVPQYCEGLQEDLLAQDAAHP